MDPAMQQVVQGLIDKAKADTVTELREAMTQEVKNRVQVVEAAHQKKMAEKDQEVSILKTSMAQLESELTKLENKASGGGGRKPLGEGKFDAVQKLGDECTRDQFGHWLHCIELQVEQSAGWAHWSRVLRQLRKQDDQASEAVVKAMVDKVNNESGTEVIDDSYSFANKSQELYTYLIPRLDSELGNLCEDEQQNGFEVFRTVLKEKDPNLANVEFHLQGEIQALGQRRCQSLGETMELVKTMDKKAKEFRMKMGRKVEDEKLAQSLWQAMDESTLDLAENNNTSKTWQDLRKFVEARYIRQKSRQANETKTTKGKLNSCEGDGDDDHEEETTQKEVMGEVMSMINEGVTQEGLDQVLSLVKGKGKEKGRREAEEDSSRARAPTAGHTAIDGRSAGNSTR